MRVSNSKKETWTSQRVSITIDTIYALHLTFAKDTLITLKKSAEKWNRFSLL